MQRDRRRARRQETNEHGRDRRTADALPELTLKDIEKALEAHLPKRHAHLLPKNYEALKRGFEAAQSVMV